MVPSGPVPRILLMSTPFSLARRRALGEICTPDCEVSAGLLSRGMAGDGEDVAVIVRAAGTDVGDSAGGCSPGATSHAIVVPTGTTSPSFDLMPARTPSA